MNVYGIFYNKEILENAKLEEPKTGWTWDDLWTYAGTLADPSSNKYGIYGLGNAAFDIANISTAAGGHPLSTVLRTQRQLPWMISLSRPLQREKS